MVRALLMGDVPAIVTYRRISALHFVLLPPRANVPAQRTWRTRGDKTAMRPSAKLLWTLSCLSGRNYN